LPKQKEKYFLEKYLPLIVTDSKKRKNMLSKKLAVKNKEFRKTGKEGIKI
jgi:hypothetical protein